MLGDWKAGRAAARTGQALDPQQLLLTIPGRAFLTWMEGRPEKALDHMRSFLADAQRRGDLQGVSVGQLYLADWLLELNQPSDAEQPAREAAEMQRIGGRWQPYPGWGWGPLAETVARLGTTDMEATLAEAEEQIVSCPEFCGGSAAWIYAASVTSPWE
jgi:hypothetical protein